MNTKLNIAALLYLNHITKKRMFQRLGMKIEKLQMNAVFSEVENLSDVAKLVGLGKQNEDITELCGPQEKKIIRKFIYFSNNLRSLFKSAIPVFISMGMSPFVIIIYPQMLALFWPDRIDSEKGVPKINDVIACFLMPAGIIYAIAFGFTFQDVLFKRQSIEDNFLKQIASLNKTLAIIQYHRGLSKMHRIKIVKLLNDYTISVMTKLMKMEHTHNESIGNMMDLVRNTLELTRKGIFFVCKVYCNFFLYLTTNFLSEKKKKKQNICYVVSQ